MFKAAEENSSPLFSKVDLATHQLLKSHPCLYTHFSVLSSQWENPTLPSSFIHGVTSIQINETYPISALFMASK